MLKSLRLRYVESRLSEHGFGENQSKRNCISEHKLIDLRTPLDFLRVFGENNLLLESLEESVVEGSI